MRRSPLLRAALAGAALFAAFPVSAQSIDDVEDRVERLEKELRAVQREVFPGGSERYFEPEITAETPGSAVNAPGNPAQAPVAVLTTRVAALEQQLANLTGQIEENGFQMRQLQTEMERFKTDALFRIQQLEGGGAAGAAAGTGDDFDVGFGAEAGADAEAETASGAAEGNAEAQYDAAYRLYESGDWAGAQTALQDFVSTHGDDPLASNAQYWLGRALLQQDQPVQAARVLLENYQERPTGERAPESLLWLGRSLMQFETPSPEKACEAYDQLDAAFGTSLSDDVTTELAEARTEADCG